VDSITHCLVVNILQLDIIIIKYYSSSSTLSRPSLLKFFKLIAHLNPEFKVALSAVVGYLGGLGRIRGRG
jgi:hypothetical protein